MAEPLRFQTSDGKEYVLEFSRRTVMQAEKSGLSIDNLDTQMMNNIPELFYFAFKKNHSWITKDETDRILFEEFKGLTTDELKQLVELYAEPYESLVNMAVDGDEKNARSVTIL